MQSVDSIERCVQWVTWDHDQADDLWRFDLSSALCVCFRVELIINDYNDLSLSLTPRNSHETFFSDLKWRHSLIFSIYFCISLSFSLWLTFAVIFFFLFVSIFISVEYFCVFLLVIVIQPLNYKLSIRLADALEFAAEWWVGLVVDNLFVIETFFWSRADPTLLGNSSIKLKNKKTKSQLRHWPCSNLKCAARYVNLTEHCN